MILQEDRKLEIDEVLEIIKEYESSKVYRNLKDYARYYTGENPDLKNKVTDRAFRRKYPNWYIPTPYFSTVVDTMVGYMMQQIEYDSKSKQVQEAINAVLDENSVDVKDMKTGIYTLAYNRGYELVYTVGDGTTTDIKYTTLDPLQCIPVYNDEIEPDLACFIWKRKSPDKKFEYYIDVIYKDEWQFWQQAKQGGTSLRQEPRKLFFKIVPVVEYRAELIGDQSPFHVVLPYIAALDWIITGNANEIDRLVDAILVLGRRVADEDLEHMEEWKVLEDMKTEDRAEYITKDMSPVFRQYVSELLINEIHKHSHVIDWYNANTAGDASAKALKTRLFDMDMYSQRLEKVYKAGIYKRIDLIAHLLNIVGTLEKSPIEVKLNRTVPTDYESKMESLKGVDWYSNQTKVEMTGGDWEIEKERLDAEMPEVDLDLFGGEVDTEANE